MLSALSSSSSQLAFDPVKALGEDGKLSDKAIVVVNSFFECLDPFTGFFVALS